MLGFFTTHLMAGPKFEKTITLSASPEAVWRAIADPKLVEQYHLAPLRKIELKLGGAIEYGTAEKLMISGTISESDPHRKLVHTFRFEAQKGATQDPETKVTWLLKEKAPGTTELTLIHEGFAEENQTYANITGGWPFILDGLAGVLKGQ